MNKDFCFSQENVNFEFVYTQIYKSAKMDQKRKKKTWNFINVREDKKIMQEQRIMTSKQISHKHKSSENSPKEKKRKRRKND